MKNFCSFSAPTIFISQQKSFLFLFSRFLAELVRVDLSHNHIVSVTNNAFASQTSLKQLRLDSNKIGLISNKTFVGLSRLEVLSLRNNEVSTL